MAPNCFEVLTPFSSHPSPLPPSPSPSLPLSLPPPLPHTRVGEARAYWSLGNAYTALGDHRQARHFAEKQLQLSLELGDEEAAATAKQNLADLNTVLELSYK